MATSKAKTKNREIVLTVAELLAAEGALTYLRSVKLPAASSFRIALLLQRIQPEFTAAHESRLACFRKFGTEKDGQIIVDQASGEALQAELIPLLEAAVSIKADKLPIAILEKAELTAEQAGALLPFLVFEEQEPSD